MSAAQVVPIEYNPHQITDKECGCGCGNLMPLGIVRKGWKYLRGHKPEITAITPSGVRKYVKSNMGPEQISAYFTAQVEQLTKNAEKLKDEAKHLLGLAKEKMAQAKEIDEQIVQLATVRAQTEEALGRVFRVKQK